ncbi:MAG: FAD-dependent oxidoreductase [Candidatus Jordarchaeum sp.]|uniref:FAD-dependent oxidoreductase n=1 Tax=Candidatus Jordarchaeum sp. TaxID=2823881 RepID=UPI00404A7FFE
MEDKVGAVLVVGGGIAGIQASLDLGDSGFKVYLMEESPSIGGVMAQLDKTFPTNDCAMCILAPKLVGSGRHPNIQLLTNASIKRVEGNAGHFKVTIAKRPRRVNEEKCTGCGVCAQWCPVEAIDEFNEGLGDRGGIFVKYPQAVPLVYLIDKEKCIGCGICGEVCRAKAIEYEQEEQELVLDVGSIILSPGFDEFEPEALQEYGYGRFPNVVSSIEFERILSASGPYGGLVIRPYDGEIPKNVAFIQCVGSRDTRLGNNYCSAACCMFSIKEAVIAKEHTQDHLDCTIFFIDMRSYGKEFDEYYKRAEEEYGVRFIRSRIASVVEVPRSRNLLVKYIEDGDPKEEEFDLVVLSVGMKPPKNAIEIAEKLGIELNQYGFCKTDEFAPLESSVPGIYVCGAFSSPKDIPDSVAQASGAAAKAGGIISSERGKLIVSKKYPPEKDVEEKEPRIGVFICHCGINIGGVVDVPRVVEYVKTLPNVVYAEHNLYTCSQDTGARIVENIKEHDLNRVVVASCTPRTHEPLFRDTIREGGLNPYLFEMANIRDQCSWVHMHEPEKATEKAMDLVRGAVAKARFLRPLQKPMIKITPVGLVIGGGLSGMTAALELAEQGCEVHLVEKEKQLGGNLRRIKFLLNGDNPGERLESLIKRVEENEKIHVHTDAEVIGVEGYIGNFKTTILSNGQKKEIQHGAIIVATGGTEYKPTEYLYGKDDRVVTQLELEERLANGKLGADTIVMVQCVGSRNHEHPSCSRVCCANAVKNALKIKELNPKSEVYVLYKDMRTYGFREEYYQKAMRMGVIFIRYDDEHKPEVTNEGSLKVLVRDPIIKKKILIEPDLLVLSAGISPNPDNKNLGQILKVPLGKEEFFLEAHMKLRPVDFATDGIFLCGLAQSPKFIDESISQACGAAARAITILSKEALEIEGAIARVDEDLCAACKVCVSICESGAAQIVEKNGRQVSNVIEALCKGCGLCGAACPSGAITIEHFTDKQILAQVRAILGGR